MRVHRQAVIVMAITVFTGSVRADALGDAMSILTAMGFPPPASGGTTANIGFAPSGLLPDDVLGATSSDNINILINQEGIECVVPGGSDDPVLLAMVLLHEYHHATGGNPGAPYPDYPGDPCSEVILGAALMDAMCFMLDETTEPGDVNEEGCGLYAAFANSLNNTLIPAFAEHCPGEPPEGVQGCPACP